jgi:hypothetical protein
MGGDIARLFAGPFLGALERFAGVVPTAAAAILFLLVGMFLARAARALLEGALGTIRLDEHTAKVGLNEVLQRLGLGKSPSFALGFIVHWFILFVFIVAAADAMNLTFATTLLESFLAFLPKLAACVLTLFGGLLFGRFVGQVLQNAAEANSIRGGAVVAVVAVVAQTAAIGASAVAALDQLGVRSQIVVPVAQILAGSAGLALAIAVGFGAKDLAGEYIRELLRPKTR